jgi:hypothetical protein
VTKKRLGDKSSKRAGQPRRRASIARPRSSKDSGRPRPILKSVRSRKRRRSKLTYVYITREDWLRIWDEVMNDPLPAPKDWADGMEQFGNQLRRLRQALDALELERLLKNS